MSTSTHDLETPSKRPTIKGVGPIARQTARRTACDCSISTRITSNGESMDIGRISRIWPNAMARAILERDQHCQLYGCTRTHNLKIHHLIHWAYGGETSVSNGASLCGYHHALVHEGNLSPTRYRFRVRNAQGIDIRTLPAESVETDSLGADAPDASGSPDSYQIPHSARAECAEPSPDHHYAITDDRSVIIAKLLVPDCKTNVLCV